MNRIGIIFALKEELEACLKKLKLIKEYNFLDLTFYECEYLNKTCILLECGIGKVNAARCTQIMIDMEHVDCLFNVGVAGSVNKNVNICDIVIGDKLVQHDFNLEAFNHERGYIPNLGKFISCDDYFVKLASEIKMNVNTHIGVLASGDLFISDEKMGAKINKKFDALCVEMEGASIAQVCFLSHIPFLIIRSISDSPNKDNNNNITYEEFLIESSEMASNFMMELLKQI